MNPRKVGAWHERRGISLVVPWLILFSAIIPYSWSLFLAATGIGDPSRGGKDWIQGLTIDLWMLLFLAASLTARATRDLPTFAGVTVFGVVLTVLGLFFLL